MITACYSVSALPHVTLARKEVRQSPHSTSILKRKTILPISDGLSPDPVSRQARETGGQESKEKRACCATFGQRRSQGVPWAACGERPRPTCLESSDARLTEHRYERGVS